MQVNITLFSEKRFGRLSELARYKDDNNCTVITEMQQYNRRKKNDVKHPYTRQLSLIYIL